MEKICEIDRCTGCASCFNSCPQKAIRMCENKEGFLYPEIDSVKCIDCGLCVRICPENNRVDVETPHFYMAWNKDSSVTLKSSSGGAFSAIAEYVLSSGGIVFGAYMNPNTWDVSHIEINDIQKLDDIRLSKYHQSNIGTIYKRVKELLDDKKLVLFSGTACQIAGLYAYLRDSVIKKRYKNLITVDVLCHGCTSKKVVKCYIKSKQKEYGKHIKTFWYRVKTRDYGWNGGVQK